MHWIEPTDMKFDTGCDFSLIKLACLASAVIDLIESRFRFAVNPDLDSLANQTAWICKRGRV